MQQQPMLLLVTHGYALGIASHMNMDTVYLFACIYVWFNIAMGMSYIVTQKVGVMEWMAVFIAVFNFRTKQLLIERNDTTTPKYGYGAVVLGTFIMIIAYHAVVLYTFECTPVKVKGKEICVGPHTPITDLKQLPFEIQIMCVTFMISIVVDTVFVNAAWYAKYGRHVALFTLIAVYTAVWHSMIARANALV